MQTLKWNAGTDLCQICRWDDLENSLAGYIRLLKQKRDRYIVITWTNPTRYVQFASLSDGSIDGEASSNHYIADEQLTAASCRRLVQLGWQSPDLPGAQKRNFWRRWAPAEPAPDMVVLAVKTLRDVFGIGMPSEFEIRRGSLASVPTSSTRSLTPTVKTGEWVPPRENPALQLRFASVVRNAISGRQYEVGELLGAGGFGAVYQVVQLGNAEPLPGKCVLKVAIQPGAWHREAYFGELLKGESGIVRVHESFAWVPRGKDRQPLYCLVSELMEGGDLAHYLEKHPERWAESKARREIIRLVRAVMLLHSSGAVHRDITPHNVFVTPGRVLKLGDFGIALHRVGRRDVPANAFARWFAPEPIRGGKTASWRPADDVYHLGQLFAMLLNGSAKSKLTADDVKTLPCTPQAKSVIQRSIGERRKRFANAAEMLTALETQKPVDIKVGVVRSLSGKRVVFTGGLTILRADAKVLVKNAGGIVENTVSHRTDVVVVGEQSRHWKAEEKGQKLLDVDHERELGHHIAVISESRFRKLVRLTHA
jgi:serine/threonine protein kinase